MEIQEEWNRLVQDWDTVFRPSLRAEGDINSETPHWPRTSTLIAIPAGIPRLSPSASTQPRDDLTLEMVASLFRENRRLALAEGEIQNVTFLTSCVRVNGALRFFPSKQSLANLTVAMIHDAKCHMLAQLKRRSASNLLIEFGRMLSWFYDSAHSENYRRLGGLSKALLVRKAKSTAITTYNEHQLKSFFRKADAHERLLLLLCLNCGMYAADIGRLTKTEINLEKGFCHWDREKEPDNPFYLYHRLWPETLKLARRFYNYASTAIATDFRHGRAEQVDCQLLAFVSRRDGKPLYRIGPSGSPANRVDRWLLPLGVSLYNLRKTTNQMLTEAARGMASDPDALIAVSELSRMFLGQKAEFLSRLYSHSNDVRSAEIIYRQMNHYLQRVGDRLRNAGVFKCIATSRRGMPKE